MTVVSLGTSTAGTGAANAAKSPQEISKLRQAYDSMKKLYEANKTALQAAAKAKQIVGVVSSGSALASSETVTPEDIARLAAEIAAVADPTGVSATVAAYTYPVCSALIR